MLVLNGENALSLVVLFFNDKSGVNRLRRDQTLNHTPYFSFPTTLVGVGFERQKSTLVVGIVVKHLKKALSLRFLPNARNAVFVSQHGAKVHRFCR